MSAERETGCLRECRHLLSARRDRIAERWYEAIAGPTFSPFAESEILACLGVLVEQAIAILTDASVAVDAAEEIGATLVRLRYLDSAALQQTVSILGEELGKDIPAGLPEVLHARLPALLGAVATGHEAAARVLVLDEQEGIRAALLAERERLTAALRESEARFRAIFANAAIGITLASLDGHAVEWNPAVERILGYNRAELARLLFTEITHPDDVAEDRALYAQLIAGKRRSYYKEKRYRHKHGHLVVCNLIASLLRDAQGNPRYVLGLLEDITSQKCRDADPLETPCQLTERERVVLQRLTEGLTREQVRTVEAMSLRTVNRTVSDLEKKLEAQNPFVLGARAALLGLVALDDGGKIVPKKRLKEARKLA